MDMDHEFDRPKLGRLARSLMEVKLTYHCPRCDHPFTKRGGWFSACGRFTCQGCGERVSLTYPEKLELFTKHYPRFR